MLEQRLEDDLKTAMLAGDKATVETLRLLRGVILNNKVANGTRDMAMSNDDVVTLLSREAKKRQESADLYTQGSRPELAEKELSEKAIIDKYLPERLSEEEIGKLVDQAVSSLDADVNMGQIIGQVKAKAGAGADGALIAKLVKERLGA
jgi:uncharacterized protein YqeY